MENKHTAGQWEVKDCHDDTRTAEIKSDGKNIATVWAYNGGSKVIDFNEQRANAHLISAAPDMLEALIECLSALKDGYIEQRAKANDMALAAIKKALNKASK